MLYSNEITTREVLELLDSKEDHVIDIEVTFKGTRRDFFSIPASMQSNLIKQGSFIIVTVQKKNCCFKFIKKIGKWGKVHVPKEAKKVLKLKDSEKLRIKLSIPHPVEEITGSTASQVDLAVLAKKRGLTVIGRACNYITLYKKNCTPITLPRFINLEERLIEAIYLLHGDGHYQSKLYFSNVNYRLHQFIIEVFSENIGIPKELWKARINHSRRELVKKSSEFWSGLTGIPSERFYPTLKLSKFNTKPYGGLRIIIDKVIVSEVFKILLEEIQELQKGSLYALNGLLNAEGGAEIGKRGLHKITLSFSQEEKEMFQDMLTYLNISFFVEQESRFCIRGWENQYQFIKTFIIKGIMPFDIHSERKLKLVQGFLTHRYTKTLKKYLAPLEGGPITKKEFRIALGHRKDSIQCTLKKQRYQRFIESNKRYLTINDAAKEFLMIIRYLEDRIDQIKKEYFSYQEPIQQFIGEMNEASI